MIASLAVRPFGALFGLVAVALVACASTPASAVDMASHRAIYNMKLHAAHRGSGISGARGQMVYSFTNACEGWSSETGVKLRLLYAEGDQVDTEWAFASWEARDGKSYQFSTRQVRNGQLVESLKGSVKRKTPETAVAAKFTEPEDKKIELPKGTLFPTRHLIDLLEAGAAGKKIYSRVVFDGASLENPYRINAIVTRRSPLPDKDAAAMDKALTDAGLKVEPVVHYRMAFFGIRSTKEEPDFELGVEYRPDGISRFIRQDFGNFVIDLSLEKLELFDKAKC
jgi:hypothetical protein